MTSKEEIRGWFAGRLPTEWFLDPPEVTVDREEITVVGRLAEPTLAADSSPAERAAAAAGRIRAFREDTRPARIAIAREAEHTFGRKVAWGATCADRRELFTHLAVPVMTRLRQPERRVLDTLVASGVARSRSDALAWSVRLVGKHAGEWLEELRAAVRHVQDVRAQGPDGPREAEGGPSNEQGGPSNEQGGPSNEQAGPSNEQGGDARGHSTPPA